IAQRAHGCIVKGKTHDRRRAAKRQGVHREMAHDAITDLVEQAIFHAAHPQSACAARREGPTRSPAPPPPAAPERAPLPRQPGPSASALAANLVRPAWWPA